MKKALLVKKFLTLGLALMAVVPETWAQSNSNIKRINPAQLQMEQKHRQALILEQERKAKEEGKMLKLKAEAEQKRQVSKLQSSQGFAAHKAIKLPTSKLQSLTRAADGVTLLDSVVSVNADGTPAWKDTIATTTKAIF